MDGRHLKAVEPYAYLLLNKPKGIVSTLNDPEGRPTIDHLLHGVTLRMFPVGRLDFDTEGLMLLTNHGELAQALLHPRYHVAEGLFAKVKGVLADEEINRLAHGVELEDGMTAPAVVKKVRKAEENSWLEVTIYEGRKHQIKRMFEVVGHPVLKLKRIKFGPLALGDLLPGEFRYLTDREAEHLARPRSNIGRSRKRPGISTATDPSAGSRSENTAILHDPQHVQADNRHPQTAADVLRGSRSFQIAADVFTRAVERSAEQPARPGRAEAFKEDSRHVLGTPDTSSRTVSCPGRPTIRPIESQDGARPDARFSRPSSGTKDGPHVRHGGRA